MLENTRLSATFSVTPRLNETNNNDDDGDSEDEEAISMYVEENLFQDDDNIGKTMA